MEEQLREGFTKIKNKVIFITFWLWPSLPPPLKVLWQLDQFFSTFGKKCIFPFQKPNTYKKFKKLVLEMQKVMHIATNAGYTAQNDGRTMHGHA